MKSVGGLFDSSSSNHTLISYLRVPWHSRITSHWFDWWPEDLQIGILLAPADGFFDWA